MAELVLIPQSDALPERVITAWGARLAPADMNRLNTFTHPRRRREFVIARTLLRTLSERVLGSSGRVQSADDGKPEWLCRHQAIPCSISHSHGAVVVGLNTEGAIGVDIETVQARPMEKYVTRYFHEAAQQIFLGLEGDAQRAFFYQYWCDREAMTKFDGSASLLQRLALPAQIPQNVDYQHLYNNDYTLSMVCMGTEPRWYHATVQGEQCTLTPWAIAADTNLHRLSSPNF